jgi:hypothetical protein
MAHTPGPWIVREPEEDELYEVYAENGGDLICYPVYTRNQRDNIHLIAAAPELLELVRTARVIVESAGHMDLSVRMWNAIANAEGATE